MITWVFDFCGFYRKVCLGKENKGNKNNETEYGDKNKGAEEEKEKTKENTKEKNRRN